MKAKQLILTVLVALFTCSSIMAQSHIDKIVDELEQKGVDVSKVVKRDPKTKKPYSIVKNLTFYSKDSNYANRLKEAFKKEAENAVQESVSNKGNNYVLIFKDGKIKTTYSMSITPLKDKDPLVSISIIVRDGNVKEYDIYDEIIDKFGVKDFYFKDQDILNLFQNGLSSNIPQSQIATVLIKKGANIDQIRRALQEIEKKKRKDEVENHWKQQKN